MDDRSAHTVSVCSMPVMKMMMYPIIVAYIHSGSSLSGLRVVDLGVGEPSVNVSEIMSFN